jgi:hypothetical protein
MSSPDARDVLGSIELAGLVDGAGQSEKVRPFAETEHPVEVVAVGILA